MQPCFGRPATLAWQDSLTIRWTGQQVVRVVRRRTHRQIPRTVTADRGYGEAAVGQTLTEVGVTTVRISRKGRPVADANSKRRGRSIAPSRWRIGAEGASAASNASSTADAPSWDTLESRGCHIRSVGGVFMSITTTRGGRMSSTTRVESALLGSGAGP